MNKSITRITLDVSPRANRPCIYVKQFDTFRRFVFSLVDKGLPYVIEDGVYAYLSAKTASDTPVFRNTQIIDGAVHFDVPASMTAEVGEIECELILHEEGNMILTSCGFDVIVFHSIGDEYADEAVVTEDYHAMVEATTAANDIARILKEKLENGEFKGDKGDPGDGVPEITAYDAGKVLTANKDGKAVWKTPTGGGSGGVTSWNDLEDRPFGDIMTECGETLAWDGTPTEIGVAHGDNKYHRVSDSTPTIDNMVGGSMSLGHGVNTYHYELQADYFEQHNAHTVFYNNEGTPFFIVVDADNTVAEMGGESLVFPKKGIYFILTSNGVYVNDITVTGYNFTGVEVKKLDKKYLPDDIGGGINITKAYVGQTIVVKAVDENGKPTEWEAVNLPKSTNIITVDSYEELPRASSVPMRTIALVTSEG